MPEVSHHSEIDDGSELPDYGKFIYERQCAAKDRQRTARAGEQPTKEIRLRVGISDHDFEDKTSRARALLAEGANVRATVEVQRIEQRPLARELAARFAEAARDAAVAAVPPQDGDGQVVVVVWAKPS